MLLCYEKYALTPFRKQTGKKNPVGSNLRKKYVFLSNYILSVHLTFFIILCCEMSVFFSIADRLIVSIQYGVNSIVLLHFSIALSGNFLGYFPLILVERYFFLAISVFFIMCVLVSVCVCVVLEDFLHCPELFHIVLLILLCPCVCVMYAALIS